MPRDDQASRHYRRRRGGRGSQAEYRRLNNDPSTWSAWESLDKRGLRTLNVPEGDFQRRGHARGRVQAAEQQLLAVKRAFLAGVVDGGGTDATM